MTFGERLRHEFGRQIKPRRVAYASYDALANLQLHQLLNPNNRTLPSSPSAGTFGSVDADYSGMGKTYTISAPENTFTTVFSITGSGYLLALLASHLATTNSVTMEVRITIDGNAYTMTGIGSGTTQKDGVIVGGVRGQDGSNAGTNTWQCVAPAFLPFNYSCLVEVRYSGATGNSANITGRYMYAYN